MTEPIYVNKLQIYENVFIDSLNNNNLFEKYNWESITQESTNISIIINYIIHSFVFQFIWDHEMSQPFGIVFNSDKSKNILYILRIQNFLKLIENIYTDDIQEILYKKMKKHLPSGELDMYQARVPIRLKRGDYCPPITKYIRSS